MSENKEWSSGFSELRNLGFILLTWQNDVVCHSEELLRWQFHEDSFSKKCKKVKS